MFLFFVIFKIWFKISVCYLRNLLLLIVVFFEFKDVFIYNFDDNLVRKIDIYYEYLSNDLC